MAAPKMKPAQSVEVNVKHVAPYPIAIRITKAEGQPPVAGAIVKMTEVGFLMKVDGSQLYKVGEVLHLYFELPAIHAPIQTDGKVIKTYDGYETTGRNQVKICTIEVHFKSLSDSQRANVENYLVQSGQKKR